jgi:hypothetical protein
MGEMSDLMGAVAWPLVVFVIALIFRAPFTSVLHHGAAG